MPNCFAIDTATPRPRALNEAVGSKPSSLTNKSPFWFNFFATLLSEIKGVKTSPSDIIFDVLTGKRNE